MAFLALFRLASVPPILDHAALATLDVAAAATTLFALYWLQRWIVSGRWRDAALFGLTTGLAFGTKFSSILAYGFHSADPKLVTGPIGLGLITRDGWRQRNLWRPAPLPLFATLLIFASACSRTNIGIRHVLVLYPFLELGAAYLLAQLWSALATVSNLYFIP
jgi:hypothetical protein